MYESKPNKKRQGELGLHPHATGAAERARRRYPLFFSYEAKFQENTISGYIIITSYIGGGGVIVADLGARSGSPGPMRRETTDMNVLMR